MLSLAAGQKLLLDLPDRKAIRECIRNFLLEPGLQKAPPDTVLVNYSGHGMQKGGTVHMLPGDANPEDKKCEPDVDFLPIRDIFKWCREDLDMFAHDLDPPRQVTFVLVMDVCRVAEMDQTTLSASLEPPAASTAKKWSICFSCSRDSTTSDCPQGAHSPFAQELLDEKAGIFAAGMPLKGGLDEAGQKMREQHEGQAPMPVGLHSIQEDWCFYPSPAQRVYSGNVPSPTAGKACPTGNEYPEEGLGRDAELDQEVVQKLKEWDLEDAADALAKAGYKSLSRLRKMDVDDVDKLGLPLAPARELKDLVQALKTEELQLPPAAGAMAQEEAAANKTAEEEANKKAEEEVSKMAVEESKRKEKEGAAAKKKAEEQAKEEEESSKKNALLHFAWLAQQLQQQEPAHGFSAGGAAGDDDPFIVLTETKSTWQVRQGHPTRGGGGRSRLLRRVMINRSRTSPCGRSPSTRSDTSVPYSANSSWAQCELRATPRTPLSQARSPWQCSSCW